MAYHTVVQGEHLSGIAAMYGFSSYKPIWNHPENATLKKERQNPNVIFPGDQVFIPDPRKKLEARITGQFYQFRLKTEKLKLRLVLEDRYKKPIDNAKCELRVETETFILTTDGQGRLETDIPPSARSAVLTIKDPRTPITDIVIPIHIGEMDPVDKESGQKARLNNLGYFAGPVGTENDSASTKHGASGTGTGASVGDTATSEEEAKDAEADESKGLFVSAVEEFQCDFGLTVDGKCGPVTQAKLKQVHGC